MIKLLADASLPGLQALFKPPFQVTTYQYEADLPDLLTNQDILLCRSTLKVTAALLAATTLRCVATASSGTDHIDKAYLTSRDISCLDAKGSNALAVANYVLASFAYLKQKQLLPGQRVGIIGMGAVGQQVMPMLEKIGFEVLPYDPIRAVQESTFRSATLADVMRCDVICIHANLHATQPFPSYHLLDKTFFQQLNPNTVIINASRGDVVNEVDLLNTDNRLIYCTDVYSNEPYLHAQIIERATLCTPHIAGHTLEAKQRAVIYIAKALYALYQIPIPAECLPVLPVTSLSLTTDWSAQILSLYDPDRETQLLKQAHDKSAIFLTLRRAHQFRHDFSVKYT